MLSEAELWKVIDELKQQLAEMEASFDLRWKADQRAIERWRTNHPERELVQPDHIDLVVWLIEQITRITDAKRALAIEKADLHRQLAGTEAAGAAMSEALQTAEKRLQCSPGNRDVIDMIYTALETDIGKTTLARIEAMEQRLYEAETGCAMLVDQRTAAVQRIERLEAALQSCQAQFAFTEQEVGWRKRLQDEIDEALKGVTP